MGILPGVSTSYRTDGTVFYRSSITYNSKHISLGSYNSPESGYQAYRHASLILNGPKITIEDYADYTALPFAKFVSLVNVRNNGIYIKTPIYLYPGYFLYYLEPDLALKFDRDDLFFYSSHTIQKKGGYLFICHYGSQYGILSRYGIRKFAVEGRDYIFANGDNHDYRYQNIKVINQYMGVKEEPYHGKQRYTVSIHVNGNFIVGRYSSETDAAIAYNKAADILSKKGIQKKYIKNYISGLTSEDYRKHYNSVEISERLYQYQPDLD